MSGSVLLCQEKVDAAPTFPEAAQQLMRWLEAPVGKEVAMQLASLQIALEDAPIYN